MKIALPAKDRRFTYLAALIHEDHEITDVKSADLIVTTWPAPVELPDNAVIVTCGPKNGPSEAVDLLLDERYQRDIAWMTAEGAIASAMTAADKAICGAECMIVGWGRIGRALAERLVSLGAEVTVLSRRDSVRGEINAAGAGFGLASEAGSIIRGKDFVFSTPPVMMLDVNVLENADKDTALIDLASPPYGIDTEAALKLGLNAWREPGLPGRYCPVNAAGALYEALKRHSLLKGASEYD